MSFTSWLRNLRSAVALGRAPGTRRRQRSLRLTTHRPGLEVLEDRSLPSTFTVLNLLDSGPDSLRAAVASANASPGADTIDFATTGTIALTSGQLDITDSLTINGPGAAAADRQRQLRQPGVRDRRRSHCHDREPDGRRRRAQ
jgi:hypothetical protein